MEEAGDGSGMVRLCGYMHGFCKGVWCWYVSVCRGHTGWSCGVTMATWCISHYASGVHNTHLHTCLQDPVANLQSEIPHLSAKNWLVSSSRYVCCWHPSALTCSAPHPHGLTYNIVA